MGRSDILRGSGKLKEGTRRALALIPLCVVVILGAVILLNLQTPRHPWDGSQPNAVVPSRSEPEGRSIENAPTTTPDYLKPSNSTATSTPTEPAASATQGPGGGSAITDADLSYLLAKSLLIPVPGVKPSQLRDSFNDTRSEGRRHEAIDIMAPQGTPVLATADGVVVKLFQSDKGGITLYEQDPSGPYVYYYAHLMRYADGIAEGVSLKRGQTIAYCGDTGDAGPGNFHLHFSISKVSSPRKWSGGDPIDPYPLLTRQ
jgi:peptidoglycan LD-endopeptidase LytH